MPLFTSNHAIGMQRAGAPPAPASPLWISPSLRSKGRRNERWHSASQCVLVLAHHSALCALMDHTPRVPFSTSPAVTACVPPARPAAGGAVVRGGCGKDVYSAAGTRRVQTNAGRPYTHCPMREKTSSRRCSDAPVTPPAVSLCFHACCKRT